MACRPVGAKPSSDICNLWYNNGWSPHTRAAKTSNRILHKKIAVFLLYRAIASLCIVLDLYSQSLQPMDMNYIYVMDAAISSIGSASQQTTSLDTEKCKNYIICNVYDFFCIAWEMKHLILNLNGGWWATRLTEICGDWGMGGRWLRFQTQFSPADVEVSHWI